MEMESSRRPLDRSREPGLKKPRLSDESERNQGLNRPFAAAQRPVANNPMVSRLRAAARESDGGDSGRGGGGGYQPQPLPAAQQHQELVSQYRAALAELTFNSKPIITNLTIIAGENVHAAKAIAATICANIIEVTSDQKLPSLYLLDSIVKNIGRDYIKHFAAKLPEVFCKAYRQVDPPIHQSMRHLFGTWKGVFPPQTLQMIEKELAFASAINGTSAGPTTSRPDSQANRPSIHVNPKYLERRLQQPNRAKGLSNDVSGSIVNSLEDAESMDRATSISTGRSWVEPSAKMHTMQHSQRGSEGIREKNISAEYADYDHGSDFRRNSGLGIDRADARIVEQGHEKPWYPDSSNLTESLSGQRNSYNIKHGFPNYSAPKSANLQSTKSIVSRSSGGMSIDSWKNSDEEEFRWGEMNSRLTEHGASDISSNFRKDRSTSVDSDRSVIEDHIHRSQSLHDYASRIHKEVSAEQKDFSTHGHRISSPWLSQDSPTHPGPSSFGYPGNGALGSGGAPPQQRFQSLKSGPSSLRQHPPSPSLTTHHLHLQLPGLAEQDRSRTQSLGHSDPKVSQFPGKFNTGMHDPYTHDTATILPSHGRPGKVVKSQANEALISSAIPGIHQSHQYALPHQVADPTESEPLNQIQKLLPPHISNSRTPSTLGSYAPDRLNAHPVNTIEDSSPSSLLAAVMKSGVLSNSSITTSSLPGLNLQNTGKLPSQKGQSPVPSGPTSMMSANPRSKVSPSSSVGNSSHDSQSASVKISQKKVELSGPPSSSSPLDSTLENSSKDIKSAPDQISNLLSSLVAKGLISASKTESPTLTPPKAVTSTETQKKSPSVTKTSPVPPSSLSSSTVLPTRDEGASVSEPSPTKPVSLPESTKSEIKNLIGFDFKPDVIRVFHPTVVSDLLDGYEHSCTICGIRMKLQERLNRHLEWHDTKKTETDGPIKASRKWYASSSDWISAGSGHTSIESVEEHGETTGKDEPMVPADESNCVCVLCGEIFEDFYCQESDEWMFKGAKHMMIPSGGGEIRSVDDESLCKGPIVHAKCITESSLQDLGLASRIKTETDV